MEVGFVLACGLMLGLIGLMVIRRYVSTDDGALVAIIVLAVVLRLLIGAANITYGPFPGAEVDAVAYQLDAQEQAQEFHETGDLSLRGGRAGYSDLLALAYILGGSEPILATLLNAVFMVAFLLLVHSMARQLSSTRRRARTITTVIALYPSVLLYTAVPLREAVLMWALALFVSGTLRFVLETGRLLNIRVIVGLGAAVWLHSGFIVLAVIPPIAWWLRAVYRTDSVGARSPRAMGLALVAGGGLLLMVAAVTASVPHLEKLPDSADQLVDLNYLGGVREHKASYGTGYSAEAGETWSAFLAATPGMVGRFLVSPLPGLFSRSGSLMTEAFKAADGLAMLTLCVMLLRAMRRRGQSYLDARVRGLLLAVLALLIVVFAIGTANVGIAVRHRAKFVWLFVLLVGAWESRTSSKSA